MEAAPPRRLGVVVMPATPTTRPRYVIAPQAYRWGLRWLVVDTQAGEPVAVCPDRLSARLRARYLNEAEREVER